MMKTKTSRPQFGRIVAHLSHSRSRSSCKVTQKSAQWTYRAGSFLTLLLLMGTLGCGHKKVAPPLETPVAINEDHDLENDEFFSCQVDRSYELYDRGRAAMEDGDVSTALELYDRALQNMLDCQVGLDSAPEFQMHLEDLQERISSDEQELSPSLDTVPTQVEASTLDRLLDETLVDRELARLEEPLPQDEPAPLSDFPLVDNEIVEDFVKVFTHDKAHIIGEGLERSTEFIGMMRPILKEYGIPQDLCYLPLIESAYKTGAISRAKAVGLWQFMSGTAKDYGLRIDWWIDERRDPVSATHAAARYLRDLYAMFGDWNIALCAYNAGQGRVQRAIKRAGTNDFWELAKRRALPRETIGYIPAFQATLKIVKDPAKYGFQNLDYAAPSELTRVKIDYGVELAVLAETLDIATHELRRINPSLKRGLTPSHQDFFLNIPKRLADQTRQTIASLPPEKRLRWHEHRIKRGDTLGRLAQRYNTTVAALKQVNRIRNPRQIQIGKQLLIPTGGMANRKYAMALNDPRLDLKTTKHRVRKGDTLYHLAKRYQTTIPSLMSLNPTIKAGTLQLGSRLKVRQGDRWQPSKRLKTRQSRRSYVVRSGDTVSTIARRHGISTTRLLANNSLTKASVIKPGQKLTIPGGSKRGGKVYYKIKQGDTLSKIAKSYGTNVRQIVKWNKLGSKHSIRAGQTLVIYR